MVLEGVLLNTLQGCHKFGFGPVTAGSEAELRVEVVWSNKGNIYTRYREDLIEILQCLRALNLDHNQDFIVHCPRVLWPIGNAKAIRTERAPNAALTNRRGFRGIYHPLRLLPRVDHRHNDYPCSGVERPLEPLDAMSGHTHKGPTGSPISNPRHHLNPERWILCAVLHI